VKTFETLEDIIEYLKENKDSLSNCRNKENAKYILPIFASKVTDEPTNMMQVYRWFDLETDINMGYVVRENLDKLKDVDLNLYKFKIICEVRGPADEETLLDETVRKKPQDENVVTAAKHKDFPEDGRNIMYEIHKDVDFLSKEAQDMFIF